MDISQPIKSIMTKEVKTVKPSDPMQNVADIFNDGHIHHLPVLQKENLVGMVSSTDLLYFLRMINTESREAYINDLRLKNYMVEEVMRKGVVTVFSHWPTSAALTIFAENLFHCLPVMEGDELVGILTTHDIVKGLLKGQKVE